MEYYIVFFHKLSYRKSITPFPTKIPNNFIFFYGGLWTVGYSDRSKRQDLVYIYLRKIPLQSKIHSTYILDSLRKNLIKLRNCLVMLFNRYNRMMSLCLLSSRLLLEIPGKANLRLCAKNGDLELICHRLCSFFLSRGNMGQFIEGNLWLWIKFTD